MSIISGTATYLRVVRNALGRIVASERPADDSDGSPAEAHLKPPKEGFRPDVEGLRAVAVGVSCSTMPGCRSRQEVTSVWTSSS